MSDLVVAKKGQYCCYRGVQGKQGALQFNLIPWDDRRERKGKPDPEGFLLVEMAPAIGINEYDWANKINFALGVNDIGAIIAGMDGKIDLYHPNDNFHKHLIFTYKEFNGKDTWEVSMSKQGDGSDTPTRYTLFISEPEMVVLKTILLSAIPDILGWNEHPSRWKEPTNTEIMEKLDKILRILEADQS